MDATDGQPRQPAAPSLSEAVFERLRERVHFATDLALEIFQAARQADQKLPLAAVRPDLHEPLRQAVDSAQQLWFDTAIQQYLIRPEPVHLDATEEAPGGRVSGTCFTDLALAITSTLLRAIVQNTPAREWANDAQFVTGTRHVGDRWNAVAAEAACECAAGVEKWKVASRREWSECLRVHQWEGVLDVPRNRTNGELQKLKAAGRAEDPSRARWKIDLAVLSANQRQRYDALVAKGKPKEARRKREAKPHP